MEELADAIEDATFLNAITTQDDGPRPVLPWNKPSDEQLAEWERMVIQRQAQLNAKIVERKAAERKATDAHRAAVHASPDNMKTLSAALKIDSGGTSGDGAGVKCDAFSLEWVCQQPIGYFLFSQFIKQSKDNDYVRINFCEEALRFRKMTGRRNRLEKAVLITKAYLVNPIWAPKSEVEMSRNGNDDMIKEGESDLSRSTPKNMPRKTEITEYDLYRRESTCSDLTPQEIKAMCAMNMDYPECSETLVGVKGPIRKEILDRMAELERKYPDQAQSITRKVEKSFGQESSLSGQQNQKKNRTTRRRSGDPLAEEVESSGFVSEEFLEPQPNVRSTSLDLDNIPDPPNNFRSKSLTVENGATDPERTLEILDESVLPPKPQDRLYGRAKSAVEMNSNEGNTLITSDSTNTMLNTLSSKVVRTKKAFGSSININILVPIDMFDKAETVVMESLRNDYWEAFQQSPLFTKLKHFLWYKDRRVVPDDFLTMRVLGRGGFGLVYACKKGTSGKLYAMKIMNKRRIKMKKSESLCLNERKALEAVNSKFVVNLNYSFHSKEDVFLILDLMTGGDLGFHLHQRRRFQKDECLYFAARIMLGLQALHDEHYVYRDLKPENCLLGEDGRVKITDLGLATIITPDLHGAAGTRGYWAPEMLRRDSNGKRMTYGHAVDWFSFGCCIAEFISGTNPFRSEAALTFGLERGKQTKEKAIDCATVEMTPEFAAEYYEVDAADLCRRLLDKNERTRLGANGCQEIMAHPWFKSVNWDKIISDRHKPPFIPPRDINAASREEISTFPEDKAYQETVLNEKDETLYKNWDWTNPGAFSAEVIEVLIYERETGEPLVPISQGGPCCCEIL